LLHPVKLNGSGDGVRGATAQFQLVINRRALRAKVNFGRQCAGPVPPVRRKNGRGSSGKSGSQP